LKTARADGVIEQAAHFQSWADLRFPECPRYAGYQGQRGFIVLILSLVAVDPFRQR
jgi:hypothetical protein